MQQQNKEITYKNGRYKRYEMLGKGTCGDFCKGYDTLKKMDTIEAVELDLMKKFKENTKNYGLRNVLNIYEVIEEPKQIILIRDYAKGGDFFNYLQTISKQSQQPTKIQCIKQPIINIKLASGLRELHQLNYFHLDMKPENILVLYDERKNILFKIADFGLSKVANNAQTTRIGTLYYMAPELMNDQNQQYGFEVDIWALGCIYYGVITGNSLFQGNLFDLMKKVKDVRQPRIDSQIDQLSKYNIIERERKLIKLMISIDPQRRSKILEVIQTLTGSDEFIKKPQIIIQQNKNIQKQPQNQNINRNPKATSIDPSLQKDIETITQKIQYQQQQIKEYYGQYGQDTDEQRITNIRNAKQSIMTEYNSIIERLQASSSMSNQANLYFNQVLSNYRLKLDKVIDTVTLRLSQIKQNLTELQQIKSKTIEIKNLIEILTKQKQQYEGQIQKYQEQKQKKFDLTQQEQIQADYEQAIRAQGQIETESTRSYNLYSQVYQNFWQHLMNVFTSSKTQLKNEQIKKKEKMKGIIANFLKENKTIKTNQECKKILDENIEQINNDFQQLREQVDVMLKQNPQEQKSFSDFDKGLREIDKQVGNIQEYTQKLKESEQKDLESFEEALKFTPNNQMNYTMNQFKLRAKIKDQALIRKILQMKDQQIKNEDILKEIIKVFEEIKERILKSLQK